MAALADRYESATGSSLFFAIGGLALLVGLAVLAVALARTRVAPLWAAAAIPIGAVVNIAGFSTSSNAAVIASNLIFLAGFGWIARLLLADPTAQPRRLLRHHVTTTASSATRSSSSTSG